MQSAHLPQPPKASRPARSARLRGLLELFYPTASSCAACGIKLTRTDDAQMCRKCADGLLLLSADAPCPYCGEPNAARGCLHCLHTTAPSLDMAVAAFAHENSARALVHALKYHKHRTAAIPLVESMTMILFPQQSDWDVLVPVPLHKHRLRERGFNQAFVLADELGSRIGLPAQELLCRNVDTPRQALLDAAARLSNVRDAFAPLYAMDGLRVLLIDDVRTTGSTAEACAIACKKAGAARVGLLTATSAI